MLTLEVSRILGVRAGRFFFGGSGVSDLRVPVVLITVELGTGGVLGSCQNALNPKP